MSNPEAMSNPDHWFDMPLVALDVETTGLDTKRDRVIEVGLVQMHRGQVIERYSQLVNPSMRIPKSITDLTGIVQADVDGAPPFGEIAKLVLERLQDRILVGHNVKFDRNFLKFELQRSGLAFSPEVELDTLVLARGLLPDLKNWKLGEVAKTLEIDLLEAHRAVHDAEAAGRILNVFENRLPEDLGQLLRLQAKFQRDHQEMMAFKRAGSSRLSDNSLEMGAEYKQSGRLGLGYLYGDDVDPYRALIRSLPDARTKQKDVSNH